MRAGFLRQIEFNALFRADECAHVAGIWLAAGRTLGESGETVSRGPGGGP